VTHRSIAFHILYYNLKESSKHFFFYFTHPSQISSVTMLILMDQEWSLLVASFVLLIEALQELFFIPQLSFWMFFEFQALKLDPWLNSQILLTFATIYMIIWCHVVCWELMRSLDIGLEYDKSRWIEHFQMSKDTFPHL